MVLLRRPGGQNLLLADPTQWANWQELRPDPHGEPRWVTFNGHITWLGPQSDFWNQQDVFPQKRGDLWPPDPYLIYGDYEVLHQSELDTVLRGPSSPVSGLRLTKSFRIDGASVEIEVMAENTASRPRSWGLWSNTRIDPGIPILVPVNSPHDLRVEPKKGQDLLWSVTESYFHFDEAASFPAEPSAAKAFISASQAWIAAFYEDTAFLKSFDWTPPEAIHPEQALVEIYLLTPAQDEPGLQELEFHGPYTTLQPGESMKQSERWTLQDFASGVDLDGRLHWARDYAQTREHR